MGKNKLEKFADMASYPHVFEYPYSAVDNVPFDMKGKWHKEFFKNDNPIVLELGCGRGEYTVGLGRMFPDKNFIAVDIKGARMWTGATESLQAGMKNVAFLRTNIEIIDKTGTFVGGIIAPASILPCAVCFPVRRCCVPWSWKTRARQSEPIRPTRSRLAWCTARRLVSTAWLSASSISWVMKPRLWQPAA